MHVTAHQSEAPAAIYVDLGCSPVVDCSERKEPSVLRPGLRAPSQDA